MKPDHERLKKIIRSEMRESIGRSDERLSEARTALKAAYLGEPLATDAERRKDGWSTFLDRSVLETVEWAKPSLLKVFAGTDEIVRFEPRHPEGEAAAEEATDYVNQVVFGPEAFQTIHDVICDALYQRVGWCKVWWEKREERTVDERAGLTEPEAVALLATGASVLDEAQVEKYQGPGGETLYNVTLPRVEDLSGVRVISLPSERVIWSKEALDMTTARFVAHWEDRTKAELIEEGYDREVVMGLKGEQDDYPETQIQNLINSDDADSDEAERDGPLMQTVRVYESYVLAPGKKGLDRWKVVYVGDENPEILEAEEWTMSRPPLFPVSSVPMPHAVAGLCLADLVMDVQRLRTEISRQLLDGLAISNQGELHVNCRTKTDEMDYDQFLRRRIGGVYHTFGEVTVMPLPVGSSVAGDAAAALAMTDKLKESRTGVGQQLQGLSADALQDTATGAQILDEAINQRLEMIARILAETLFKPVGQFALRLVVKHQAKPMQKYLKGRFLNWTPKNWDPLMDVKVSVGLGTGNQGRKVQNVQIILSMQEKIIGAMGTKSPIRLTNVYSAMDQMVKALGFDASEPFIGNVEDYRKAEEAMMNEEPQPSPDEKILEFEMKKAEVEQQSKTMQVQADIELDRQKAQADISLKQAEAQARIALEEAKMAYDYNLKQQQIEAEAQLDAAQVAMGQKGPGVGLIPEQQL